MFQKDGAHIAWQEYSTRYGATSVPRSVEAMMQRVKELSQYNQSLLNEPPFSMLRKVVNVNNTTIELPERPGVLFGLRVYKPKRYTGSYLAVMLYFNGGFWCSGDATSEDFGCRAIISGGTEIVIASFEYRLTPETSWNEIFFDVEFAMKWVNENAEKFGADVSAGFIVGGASSGAHLAAVCAIRARDRHPSIKFIGQNLVVSILVSWPDGKISNAWEEKLRSHIEQRDAVVMDGEAIEMFVHNLGVFPMRSSAKERIFHFGLTYMDCLRHICRWMNRIRHETTDFFLCGEIARSWGAHED